jgi:hypothetical protein
VGKVQSPHNCRLTSAKTSLKVAACLQYQAACLRGRQPSGARAVPKRVTKRHESKEQRGGPQSSQICPLPLSSQCPDVLGSPQTWLPKSSASCASRMISSAAWAWSVENKAFGGRFPAGSRVSTQRIGKGTDPKRYQQAVPLQISSVRAPCPYQSKVRRCHEGLSDPGGGVPEKASVSPRPEDALGHAWCVPEGAGG